MPDKTSDDLPTSPLLVEWTSPDGTVGGRTERGTFKVRGALPGDTIRVDKARRRGRSLLVESWTPEVLAHRAEHPCPVIDRCGGCDLGRMDPTARRAVLTRMVRQSLHLDADPEWVAPETSHRSRIKLTFGESAVGYHAARSHDFVGITACEAAHPLLAAHLPRLLEGGPVPGASSIELRTDGKKVVGVLDKGRPTPAMLPSLDHVAVGRKTVRGDARLALEVLGIPLRAGPASFFQVNAPGNELLVKRVVDNVVRIAPERVLDLYAGIGNLTLPIARAGFPTAAVEFEGQATDDLRHNARSAKLSVEIHTGRVERFDITQIPFDMVVLDPPRAGAPGVVERLLLHRPRALQFVSCHVASAARDIRPALEAGYRITDVAVVDLFSPTHHVETMVLLERS